MFEVGSMAGLTRKRWPGSLAGSWTVSTSRAEKGAASDDSAARPGNDCWDFGCSPLRGCRSIFFPPSLLEATVCVRGRVTRGSCGWRWAAGIKRPNATFFSPFVGLMLRHFSTIGSPGGCAFWAGLSALVSNGLRYPGRCPGLVYRAPLALLSELGFLLLSG